MSAVKGGNMMKIPYTPLRYTNYALHVRNAGKKKNTFWDSQGSQNGYFWCNR